MVEHSPQILASEEKATITTASNAVFLIFAFPAHSTSSPPPILYSNMEWRQSEE